tara:strand:- start:607 stop:741 length:135 start_codon:yes stop_codon:yes gene_type:complete
MKRRSTILKTYKPKKKRKGIHSKKKTSKHKQSKNYVKLYKGQGK